VDFRDWQRLMQRRHNAPPPPCPECAADRTEQTVGRALYCGSCGCVWTLIDDVLASLPPTESRTMVWLYRRQADMLELETRYRSETDEYVLELREPQVAAQIERFTDVDEFHARLMELETRIDDERWESIGPPVVIADRRPDRNSPS
jgi:hypothetical protein